MKMNRAKAILLLTTLATCCAMTQAAMLSVGTYVCNPGALVRVPVVLDNARGLSGISVTLAYDPQVVVCSRVEAGDLTATFNEEFISHNDGKGTAGAFLFKLGENVVKEVGGTVATFVFLARNGTAGQFSDITVTKVELLEESGVLDATVANPVSTISGMIRVMAVDAEAARLEGAQIVAAGTRLKALAVSEGDGIQASGDGAPVIISGEVVTTGAMEVAAPDGGWDTGEYALLRTATAGLAFHVAADVGDNFEVAESRDGGVSTYTLAVQIGDALAVSAEEPLSASAKAFIRSCVGKPAGVRSIAVRGSAEAVGLARAFGITPAVSVSGGVAEAAFAMPTLKITGLDVENGTVDAVVVPGAGNAIAGSGAVVGVIEVLGSDNLGEKMSAIDRVEVDLSRYFNAETAGEFKCIVNFGGKRFFRVRITEE